MKWFDDFFEQKSRAVAQQTSRRSALLRIGRALVGTAFVLPVLPFDRSAKAMQAGGDIGADLDADQRCDYWRYCSLDGHLCTCCGGSITSCPPGTEPSSVTWIGTCENPDDGKHYLVSYNDCCGVTSCGRCFCNENIGERPGYRMGVHNDINWCMGNESSVYHCTVSIILGVSGKA
ncbi:MAG: methylamine dehydrogenase light chain [Gammaproteobacteria bacterium]